MHRFFAQELENDTIIISDQEEVQHAKHSLRIQKGEEIEAVLNQTIYVARVDEINNQIVASVLEIKKETNKKGSITLIQGTPKGTKFDDILRQNTEIGVDAFILVDMKRSVAKAKHSKLERYEKILQSATKQSKGVKIPTVEIYHSLQEIDFDQFDQIVVFDEELTPSYIPQIEQNHIAMIIGPEGGLDQSEREFFLTKKASSYSLGERILRTETAALFASSVILNEWRSREG